MHEPYKMIVVSSIASVILLSTVLFYKYIYPQKKINPLVLLLFLSFLPLISMFRPGTYESGDFNFHLYKAIEFYHILTTEHILPSWGGNLNATYGYPVFLFAQPLPYLIISLFHMSGIPFIESAKLLFALTFILSGISMFWWAKEEFDKRSALVIAIFYLYAPYHLVDMHFRANAGEVFIFVFFPLCMYAIKKIISFPKLTWVLAGSLSIALLILSHPTAVTIFPFLAAYSVFLLSNKITKKKLSQKISMFFSHSIPLAINCLVGLLLSAFYWLPVVFESSYIHGSHMPNITFRSIAEYIYSPWRFGLLFQGNRGELSFVIGYVQWFLIFLAFWFLFKKKYKALDRKYILFFTGSFFVIFFMMQSISQPLWAHLPLLRNIEFSYRLLILQAFISATIAGLVIKNIKQQWIVIFICLVAIFSTILNWGHRHLIPDINDAYLKQQLPYSTYQGEGLGPAKPLWTDPVQPWHRVIPNNNIEFVKGAGDYILLKRTSTKHEYIINAKTDTLVKENTLYFPGWTVLANNKPIRIIYTAKKEPGIIHFNLKRGIYKVELLFQKTPIRHVSQVISLTSLVALALFIFIILINENIRRKIEKLLL